MSKRDFICPDCGKPCNHGCTRRSVAEEEPKAKRTSTERVRKWRAANPEWAKRYNRDYLRMWRAKK